MLQRLFQALLSYLATSFNDARAESAPSKTTFSEADGKPTHAGGSPCNAALVRRSSSRLTLMLKIIKPQLAAHFKRSGVLNK